MLSLEVTTFWGCDSLMILNLSDNDQLSVPSLSTWRGLNSMLNFDADWHPEYIEQALQEAQEKGSWRALLLVTFCKRISSHPLMDYKALLSTILAFVSLTSTQWMN
eukprot:TRINITY_DN1022_c0_g2_i6.p1 TRINITY_DN1022_c0_g2~~TRINITY_DN1022_c0_g2_i6.p1  ORF type:complete len:106 (-),score=17.08 TRINITY_DN1022_c0_g2_i6:64-381(-)